MINKKRLEDLTKRELIKEIKIRDTLIKKLLSQIKKEKK